MTLIIQEPQKSAIQSKAFGIDLGTTHSIIAQEQDGKLHCFEDKQNQALMPSCVHYGDNNQVVVGCEALAKFKQNCPYTYRSVKRLLGRDNVSALNTPCGSYTPQQASTHILQGLVKRLPNQQNIRAVITVPAYFTEVQRQLTQKAAFDANIEVLRLLNEPTAAAVAYGLDNQATGCVLVFDFGGGTFDVSVLNIANGVIEVEATNGDTHLGGDDIDEAIVEWIKNSHPTDLSQNELLSLAKQAKEQLTTQDTTDIWLENNGAVLTRVQFEKIIQPVCDKLIQICQAALKDAKLPSSALDAILCVGGSSKIPYLQQKLESTFKVAVKSSIDPELVVAKGAAIQASLLSGHRPHDNCLLLDVAPLSLGLETMGGLVEKLIERNSRIPVQKTVTFTTQQDGQTAFSLKVVQGEREFAKDNQELAHFYLKGLPRLPKGQVKVDVTFTLDRDGLLNVTATTQDKQNFASKSIKPTFGINEHDINRSLQDAVSHAGEDVSNRLLNEQRIKAREFSILLQRVLASRKNQASDSLAIELQDFANNIDTLDEVKSIKQKIAYFEAAATQLLATATE